MADHPIQGLMKTAMEQITEMVNIDTVVGSPIETPDGSVILPISKVGFGFAAGGSEFQGEVNEHGVSRNDALNANVALPFGGGSGGGVSITPIAFLVVGKEGVKVVPLDNQTHIYERIIDSVPQVVEKVQSMLKGKSGGAMSGLAGMTGMAGGSAGSGMTSGMGTSGMSTSSSGMGSTGMSSSGISMSSSSTPSSSTGSSSGSSGTTNITNKADTQNFIV